MATITSAGLGSGLDINGLVSQIMTAEAQPLTALNKKEATYQAKLVAYNQIRTSLQAFQSAVTSLGSADKFRSLAAKSADSAVYTATADTSAVPGTYSIEVKQLAQSQKLTTSAFTTVDDALGTGTITFQYGTDDGAGAFSVNSAKAAQSVTIDSAHGTLSGVRDAINAANIGVSASIINDGTGYKLSLTSKDTGAVNSLKITVSGDSVGTSVDNNGLSKLAYDPAGTLDNGKNMTQTVAAKNAILKVDGIDNINKASNTVTDVVQGVTINLLTASALNTPAVLTVSRDTASVQSSVQQFVKAYNDINKTLSDSTAYNDKTKQGAILLGDSTARSLRTQVRSILSSGITGLSGPYTLLSHIGVSFQKDGTLSLDTAKLQTALNSGNDIAGIFAAVGKPSDAMISYVNATDNTKSGSYPVAVTQLATQGYRDGVGTAALANTAGTFSTPFVVDSSNDTLSLKIDGVQTGVVALSQGTYTTASALVAELQSKINGDSSLQATGAKVTVSFDNVASKLRITSNGYGSVSTAEIVAVGTNTAATLGLDVGVSTAAGVDVAGTINGAAATGSGRYLTGAVGNEAEGLKLQITGGAIGARGTVDYSQGYAYQVDKFVKQAVGVGGPMTSRTEGINKTIADIGKQRDVLNTRLSDIEARYRAQFKAMDTLVGQLRSTGDFLTRQFAVSK